MLRDHRMDGVPGSPRGHDWHASGTTGCYVIRLSREGAGQRCIPPSRARRSQRRSRGCKSPITSTNAGPSVSQRESLSSLRLHHTAPHPHQKKDEEGRRAGPWPRHGHHSDEMSDVSIRDVIAVLKRWSPRPGPPAVPGRSWSVPGGGGGRHLAAKISRLGAEGAIVAPQLVVNRGSAMRWTGRPWRAAGRQDPASQVIRTDHGWEHEEASRWPPGRPWLRRW
jgi:hypothetical protein